MEDLTEKFIDRPRAATQARATVLGAADRIRRRGAAVVVMHRDLLDRWPNVDLDRYVSALRAHADGLRRDAELLEFAAGHQRVATTE